MSSESFWRLGVFVLVLAALAWAEARWPRRPLSAGKLRRWTGNLGLVVLDAVLARLLFPLLPVGLALLLEDRGWGLLRWAGLSPGWAFASGILILDLAIYAQHWAFHVVRPLWRLHRMHHADLDIDVSTALRFHPGEILLSLAWKMGLTALFGLSPACVLAFEIGLNACAMFNHANLALPQGLDRWLRLVLVTPDMHRVHHSTDLREANTNYGFNLPWWDRLFGTYKAQPDRGHLGMDIGLNIFREPRFADLWWLLALPFMAGRAGEKGSAGKG